MVDCCLLVVVSRALVVVCWFGVCRLLCDDRCWLFGVCMVFACCVLFVVCWLSFVFCCRSLMFVAVCCVWLFDVGCVLTVGCCVLSGVCCFAIRCC